MNLTSPDHQIDYIEIPMKELEATKNFYNKVFGWKFEDYGPDYTSFSDGRLNGGFTKQTPVQQGGVLVVIYSNDLASTQGSILANGGSISKDIFSFPGGRRFHFKDPNTNELAVWSDR